MTDVPRPHLARLAPRVVLVVALGLASALSGCGGEAAPSRPAELVVPVSLRSGDPVPAPRRATVLRLRGRIETRNVGRALALDLPTIERLGAQRIDLDEPFKKRRMSFLAVPLRSVIALASPSASARTVHGIALNDYTVDIPRSVAEQRDVYLATRTGSGRRIPVADGGPIRVVFLDGAEHADVDDYWIWSLSDLVLR